MAPTVSVVVPSIGRPSLLTLLDALSAGTGPAPEEVVVVDDRAVPSPPLDLDRHRATVLYGRGRGPAAARNLGWRHCRSDWVAFLDDDVLPDPDWPERLAADLEDLDGSVAGSQARLRVPLPADRSPTDWERNVAGLEGARWATADLAYRRDVLEELGGFDERFPRAFREDADLGLRVEQAGYLVLRGNRTVAHPVRVAGRWVSVKLQAGNADDVVMRARWGPAWRILCGAEGGRTGRHLLTVGAGVAALAALAGRRRRLAAVGTAGWLAGTAELAWARIAPGPRTREEVLTMLGTSAVLPAAAVAGLASGLASLPSWRRDTARAPLGVPVSPLALTPPRVSVRAAERPHTRLVDPGWVPAAVLFDRDGTLIHDRPGTNDPAAVTLMPGARVAVQRARAAGLAVGVVTNQAAVGRGDVTMDQVRAINDRVEAMLGPIDTWQVCPHLPEDGCGCRKPNPGLVLAAADELGVEPARCVVIGDIGADVWAAAAGGARGVLVPTPRTRRPEIAAAPAVAADLLSALDVALAGLC